MLTIVTWNERTGNLKGKFTIKDQGKNKMGSRLFYLIAEKSSQMTVVVKEHLGMSESGDGYSFSTKDGNEFYIYNAGGASSLKGESNIIENATICLKFSPNNGDITSISKVNVSNTYKTQKSKISSILLFNKVTLINKTIFECIQEMLLINQYKLLIHLFLTHFDQTPPYQISTLLNLFLDLIHAQNISSSHQ
jgi:hypothetical protein